MFNFLKEMLQILKNLARPGPPGNKLNNSGLSQKSFFQPRLKKTLHMFTSDLGTPSRFSIGYEYSPQQEPGVSMEGESVLRVRGQLFSLFSCSNRVASGAV